MANNTRRKTPPADWTPSPRIAALSDEELLDQGRKVLRELIGEIAEHCQLRPLVCEQAMFGDVDGLPSDELCDALERARDILLLARIGLPLDMAAPLSDATRERPGGRPRKRTRTRAKKGAR